MHRFYNRIQFYIKALLWFLVLVVIFLSAFIYVYWKTTGQLKTDTINKTLTLMQRGAKEINDSFYGFFNTYEKIITLSELQVLARGDLDGLQPPDYSQMLKLQKRLDDLWTFNEYITDIMLVFDTEQSFAVSPLYVLHDLQSSYENHMFSCKGYNYANFLALIRDYANSHVLINRYTKVLNFTSLYPTLSTAPQGEKIIFSYKLGIPYKKYDVYAVLFLDVRGLQRKLVGSTGETFAITNGEDILFSSGAAIGAASMTSEIVADRPTASTWLRVSTGNISLSYHTALQDTEIIRQISRFTTMLHMLLAVFIGISVLMLVFAAIYVIKPLQSLFNRLYGSWLKTPQRRGQGIRHIFQEIDALSSDNLLINDRLSHLEPLIRTNLLGRLIRGEFLKEDEKQMLISFLDTGQDEAVWQVAVIGEIGRNETGQKEAGQKETGRIEAGQKENSQKEIDPLAGEGTADISQQIWQQIPEAIIYLLHSRYLAVFTRSKPAPADSVQTPPNLETAYRRMLGAINQNCSALFAIGIGDGRTDLFELHLSFNEAEKAFREADIWKQSEVVLYSAVRENSLVYNIPYHDIEKLYNFLGSGDSAQAGALLDDIVQRTFVVSSRGKPNYYICRQFFHEILGVLLRLAAQRDLSPILNDFMAFDENISLTRMVSQFKQAFDFVAETVRSSSKHISLHVLFLDMQNFICKNYADSGLSLKMLSRAFSLSEPYLSLIFKNESGLNFSSFLEDLRLAEAEKLLLETRLPVKEIAQNVGYNMPNTFFKAFKRKHGITPTAWLEMQRRKPAAAGS